MSQDLLEQARHISGSVQIALSPLFQPDESVSGPDIVAVCDTLDEADASNTSNSSVTAWVRLQALKFQRYELLAKLMRADYDSYIATASFLSPSRIPRLELPNLQDVPIGPGSSAAVVSSATDAPLVPDCDLPTMKYKDNLLDQLLLSLFRNLVTKHTNGVTSPNSGIKGLLDQGRTFMLQNVNQDPALQHAMVKNTLGDLMTPALPPFYRIFMAGILPGGDRQWGPWFYAPWLTSIVTPTFFGFLVGPSIPNRRKDGHLGE